MMLSHLPNHRFLSPRRACCLLLVVLLANAGLVRADAQVVPSLMVLTVPLSGDMLLPLKSWKVQRLLDVGPMSISLPAQADLKYTYLGVREQAGQKEAVLRVEGTLRGQRSNAGNQE